MNFNNINSVYFIGIGGIGMSALARYFHAQGYVVSGYDKTPSPLTQKLQDEGVLVSFVDDESKLPEVYIKHKKARFYLESSFLLSENNGFSLA